MGETTWTETEIRSAIYVATVETDVRDPRTLSDRVMDALRASRTCRECGCTDLDCRGCVERTGAPCSWVPDLENDDGPICSACADV